MADRTFVTLTIGRIVQAAITLLTTRLMTSFLPVEQVGYTYLVYSLYAYFAMLFINPVGVYLNRHLHSIESENNLGPVYKVLNVYYLIIALLAVPVLAATLHVFHFAAGLPTAEILILVFLTLYFGTWFQTIVPHLNLLGRSQQFVYINVITTGLALLVSLLLVKTFGSTTFYWMLGALVAQVFGS